MPNIKQIIYKAAKKLASTKEIDITPEELASLALFKVMNMPYFEKANDFLNLHYNIFNEISMGNMSLNNLKGYTNGNVDSFVVLMNIKETLDSKIDFTNIILKQEDYHLLELFSKKMNSSNSLFELSDEIAQIEKTSPMFLNKIMNIMKTESHYGNQLLRALTQITPYEKGDSFHEYMFESQNKTKHYRGERHYNDLKEFAFNNYALKDLSRKTLAEIIEAASPRDVDALTGVDGLKKEDLNNFKKTHPAEYEKSMYKVFKDNPDQKERAAIAFNLNFFKEEVKILNKQITKILSHMTVEDLTAKYDEHLQPILKLVAKNYPQVMKDVKDTPYEIKTFIYNTEDEKSKFIDKEHPLEIYQDDYMRMNYPSIRGLTFYKEFWRSNNGIYISANNGLEDLVGSEGDFRTDLSTAGHRISMDNVRIYRVYEAGRNSSLESKQDVIEGYVKLALEKNIPLVYDIFERDHTGQSKFNNDVKIAIKNLKEKYPTVIFVNDGITQDDTERLANDMKADLLLTMNTNDFTYQQMLKGNKKIEEFFDTTAFKDLAKLDYFERRGNTLIKEAIDNALAATTINKNKIKVAP